MVHGRTGSMGGSGHRKDISANMSNQEQRRQCLTVPGALEDVMGRIFEVQRFSIHDGPGIRTTVFLQGCPLRCLWCHNPEGMSFRPGVSFDAEKCIGCGYCFGACEQGGHKRNEAGAHVLDRSVCRGCGKCAAECYAGALEVIGREVSAGEVVREAMRDEAFYRTSGGGLTLSGGEPLAQIEFAEAILIGARAAELHCAVETSGYVEFERFRRLMPLVDLFLYDIKETDEKRHLAYTGMPAGLGVENLRALHELGAAILVRLPIVPGLNDREEHFAGVAELVKSLPRLLGVEVMPYHPMGAGKHARMGINAAMEPVAMPDDATVQGWRRKLRELGVNVVG